MSEKEKTRSRSRPSLSKSGLILKTYRLTKFVHKLSTLLNVVMKYDAMYFFSGDYRNNKKIETLLDKIQDVIDTMRKRIIKAKKKEAEWDGIDIEFSTSTQHKQVEKAIYDKIINNAFDNDEDEDK